jgi:hypothetical protein
MERDCSFPALWNYAITFKYRRQVRDEKPIARVNEQADVHSAVVDALESVDDAAWRVDPSNQMGGRCIQVRRHMLWPDTRVTLSPAKIGRIGKAIVTFLPGAEPSFIPPTTIPTAIRCPAVSIDVINDPESPLSENTSVCPVMAITGSKETTLLWL